MQRVIGRNNIEISRINLHVEISRGSELDLYDISLEGENIDEIVKKIWKRENPRES